MSGMSQMPDHDWVSEEAEALLDADPELRVSIQRQMAESRAGTLKTTPDEVVRVRMAELRAAQRQRSKPK